MSKHTGVRKPKYDKKPYTYRGSSDVPNEFAFVYNNGKNTMIANYSRPNYAYYTNTPYSYDERWNERNLVRARKV